MGMRSIADASYQNRKVWASCSVGEEIESARVGCSYVPSNTRAGCFYCRTHILLIGASRRISVAVM